MLATTLLLAAAAVPARTGSAAPSRELVQIFLDACVTGQRRLSRDEAREIGWDEVYEGIKWHFRRDEPVRFYKISRPLDATLAIGSYDPPTEDGWAARCILFSDHIKRQVAWKIIAGAVPGGIDYRSRQDRRYYALDVPQLRYRLTAETGDYRHGTVMLQMVLYDEATAARLFERQYRRLKSLRKHGFVKRK